MTERKSYGQFCGLARALDHVGDRWTLLLVRELLLGRRTFKELDDALPGLGPSLLTKRLIELAEDGLVERNDAPRRSRSVEYALTSSGRDLEPVIIALIRWGDRWMLHGPGDDRVDPRWAPLALRALLEGERCRRGVLHVDVDGVHVTIASVGGRRKVVAGRHGRPHATVTSPLPSLLAIAAGVETLAHSGAAISGDVAIAAELLTVRR